MGEEGISHLEGAAGLSDEFLLEVLTIQTTVGLLDLSDLLIRTGCHNLDEDGFRRTEAGHGLVQLLGIVECRWLQQGQDEILEVTGQLGLEVLEQVFAIHHLEGAGNFLPLPIGAGTQHTDDLEESL